MAFKGRTESDELIRLRILNRRMELDADLKRYYLNLEKGFKGEVQFDALTEKLQNKSHILNDLLLEVNNTFFQIDSSIIKQETYYFFEVKNFEDDYFYGPETFRTEKGKEISNPHEQLKRSKSLLRQLFQNLGYKIHIEAFVVFINPEFTLYNAPNDLPFIYPTQINRFLKKLDLQPSKLSDRHIKLANQLVSLHIHKFPYTKIPPYDYDHLKKKITCKDCHSFSLFVRGTKLVCNVCSCEENVESAVLRMIEEFKLLFPNRKITTNDIYDWCRIINCKKRISRILGKNFKMVGVTKGAYYE